MSVNDTTLLRREGSVLSYHSVLRNTYLLLGISLLFSAFSAGIAVATHASFTSSIVTFVMGFILLFVTSALRHSAWGILSVFAFTSCMGYSMGPMLNHFIDGYKNGGQLIMTALAGTGITFFASSAYVLVTKKELSHWGKFLMIGLVMCLIAAIANIFLQMPAMQLAVSTLLVFISTMLMMYDTSRILHHGETNYIMATVSLFIDIQMLFQNLLSLLGIFSSKE